MDLRFDKMQAADFNIKIRFVGIYIATVIIAIVIHRDRKKRPPPLNMSK